MKLKISQQKLREEGGGGRIARKGKVDCKNGRKWLRNNLLEPNQTIVSKVNVLNVISVINNWHCGERNASGMIEKKSEKTTNSKEKSKLWLR